MFSQCGSVLFLWVSCCILNKMSSAESSITNFFPDIKGNLSRVTWAHAVNNLTYLVSTLNNSNTMMIEADVVLGTLYSSPSSSPIPIMAHPPANSSDLSLDYLLELVAELNDPVNSTVHNTTEGPNGTTIISIPDNNETNNATSTIPTSVVNNRSSSVNISGGTNVTENANAMNNSSISNNGADVSNSSLNNSSSTNGSSSASEEITGNVSRSITNVYSKKGVKLDFKTIEAFNGSIAILKKYSNVSFPLWLNADIFPGPVNSTVVPVDANNFLSQAKQFAKSTLSLGWTTNAANVNGSYTDAQIDNMVKTIKSHNIANEITFAVRSSLAAESLPQMKKLLSEIKGSTLTLWSAETDKVDVAKLRTLIAEIGLGRIFIDVPDRLMKELRLDSLPSKPNSATLMSKMSGVVSLVTLLIVLFA